MKDQENAFMNVFLATCLSILMIVILINAAIDPYQIIPSYISLVPRGHPAKAMPGSFRLIKAMDIMKLKPKAIILGTSRAELGFRAQDITTLLNVECYNLGLDGGSFQEIYAYFEHALFHQPDLKYVIIGLDLFSFNKNRSPRPDFSADRLSRKRLPLMDYMRALLSQEACKASYSTLKNLYKWYRGQEIPGHFILDDRGNATEESRNSFFPEGGLSEEEEDTMLMEKLLTSPRVYGNFEFSEEALNLLKKMVTTCREHGITLKIFFSPSRVVYWYGLKLKGLGDRLRRLKTEVVQLADAWDFSGANAITSTKSNYFDFSHFRPHLGRKLLPVIFDLEQPTVGVKLTSANIIEHLEVWERDLERWAMSEFHATDKVYGSLAFAVKK